MSRGPIPHVATPGSLSGAMEFEALDFFYVNKSGGTQVVGQCIEFDASGAVATNNNYGDLNSTYSVGGPTSAAGVSSAGTGRAFYRRHGIVIGKPVLNNAIGKVRVFGKVKALVFDSGNSSIAKDDLLFATTAVALEANQALATNAGKRVGYFDESAALATGATAGAAVMANIFFDGITWRGSSP